MVTKLGYINNPNWQSPETNKHEPCGYWYKGPLTYTAEGVGYWQQSIVAIDNSDKLGVGALLHNADEEGIVLTLYDASDAVVATKTWTEFATSGYPGILRTATIGGVETLFYLNYVTDAASLKTYVLYSLNANGVSNRVVVFAEFYTDGDNNEYHSEQHWSSTFMDCSDDGKIVTALSIYRYDGGDFSNVISTRRSDDYGATLEDAVEITLSSQDSKPCLRCDSNGDFYVIIADYTLDATKYFLMWKSVDDGASWSQITTTPTGTMTRMYDIAFATTGLLLYAFCRPKISWAVNRFFYSADGGATWTETTPAIAGESSIDNIDMRANGAVVVVSCSGGSTGDYYLIKSINNGSTWSIVGTRIPATTWPSFEELYGSYTSFYNDQDHFVFTSCKAIEADESLAYLDSDNDGVTWDVESLPIFSTAAAATVQLPIVINPVWKL